MHREKTRRITVGGVPIGGGAPVSVQSMTNTRTQDTAATLAQIARLREAGCDIVRVAVPDMESARAIAEIRAGAGLPVVADIHFDHQLAMAAIESGADKIRINPGNMKPRGLAEVAEACAKRGIPVRVGVNGGSLDRELLSKHGGVTAAALAESALAGVELLRRHGLSDICVSIKASDVERTTEACKLFAGSCDLPIHLGVTEAGGPYTGLIRSSVGIGALLLAGIGDTIRVSLTADPAEEVRAGIEILKSAGLRRGGPTLISCPSCGRCGYDLIGTAREVEQGLRGVKRDITVAVMGCAVNGPGEAREADFGVAGAKDYGLLFKKGEVVGRVPVGALAGALLEMIERETRA